MRGLAALAVLAAVLAVGPGWPGADAGQYGDEAGYVGRRGIARI